MRSNHGLHVTLYMDSKVQRLTKARLYAGRGSHGDVTQVRLNVGRGSHGDVSMEEGCVQAKGFHIKKAHVKGLHIDPETLHHIAP